MPDSDVSTNLASVRSQFSKPIFLNRLLKKSAVTILAPSNNTFSIFDSLKPDKFKIDSWNFTFLILASSKLTPVILQFTNSALWIDAPKNTVFEKSFDPTEKTTSFTINGYETAVLKIYLNDKLTKEQTIEF